MAFRTRFGCASGALGGLPGNSPRNAQVALQLVSRWQLTKIVGVTYRQVLPTPGTHKPISFRLFCGLGTIDEATSITPAGDTIVARGGSVTDIYFDVTSPVEIPIVISFNGDGPIIPGGASFFALVGQILYDDGTSSPAVGLTDTGSISVFGTMLDVTKNANVTFR